MFLFSDDPLFTDEELFLMCAASGGKTVQATALGNPLTFITDKATPLKSLLIPFTPVQSGTGDPSPENIRPILPWNGLTVFGGGKNLLPNVATWLSAYPTRITLGSSTDRGTNRFGKGTYKLSFEYDGSVYVYIKVNNSPNNIDITSTKSFTLTEESDVAIWLYKDGINKDKLSWFQLEVGQTATAYEPYKPITETDIIFQSPVYGGTLDVVSGVLTVTHEGLVSTWGQTKVDRKQSGYQQGRIFFTHDVPVSGQSGASATNQKCNIAKYQWDDFNGTPHFYTGTLEGRNCAVILIPEDTPDETEIVVSAKLRTTYEVQLTPTQIAALVGDNTIWSDADGSMTAVYLKKG